MTLSITDILLSVVASAGGGAVVAGALFRGFGTRWLDNRFASQQQDLRHQHERQIESVRSEASRILDRTTRLNEREFEVTAEAWGLVFEASIATGAALMRLFRAPDFMRSSDEVVRRVAESENFASWERDELLKLSVKERGAYYAERREIHRLIEAKTALRAANVYLAKNALFIEKSLLDRMRSFCDEAWDAIADWEFVIEMRGQGPLPENATRRDDEFRKEREEKVSELEELVRSRFWPS